MEIYGNGYEKGVYVFGFVHDKPWPKAMACRPRKRERDFFFVPVFEKLHRLWDIIVSKTKNPKSEIS